MTTISITTTDLATARRLSGARKPAVGAYADRWHASARNASPTGYALEAARGFDHAIETTPAIAALTEQLLSAGNVEWIGYDEAALVSINGRVRRDVRSQLPRRAGLRSHATSLAIEILAALDDAGASTVSIGSVHGAWALGRVELQVAA